MNSCKEVSELVTQAHDRKLTLKERLTVRMHLLVCKMCCHYQQQIKFLSAASRRFLHREGTDRLHLPNEARARIQQTLEQSQPPDEGKT